MNPEEDHGLKCCGRVLWPGQEPARDLFPSDDNWPEVETADCDAPEARSTAAHVMSIMAHRRTGDLVAVSMGGRVPMIDGSP